jgi:multiple sugar transport system ATP-binding protein
MVFQSYALFPHMTVHQNLSFGMRIRKVPQEEIERRVVQAAEILGITELLQRRPKQLSGGQRQRVAMGRAILRDPKVSLFDEPLSNLDARLRIQMRAEIRKVHQRVPTTVIYVTHDQVEAMTLADRIVVMNRGRIEQVGTPQDLYDRPATQFVAGFIGSPPMNFIPCRLELAGDRPTVQLVGGPRLPVPAPRVERYAAYAGREMTFGIRPEHLTERRAHVNALQTDFEAPIEAREPMGNDTMLYFSLAGVPVCARATPVAARNIGETMPLTIDMNAMQLIDPETGKVVAA